MLDEDLRRHDVLGKQAIEFAKMASEFSKLLLVNLVSLNAAGLAAIAFLITAFSIGKNDINKSIAIFSGPGSLFITGVLFALLSMFFAYLNFNHASLGAQYFLSTSKAEDIDESEIGRDKALRDSQNYYYAAYASGWGAFLTFVVGAILLFRNISMAV